MTTHPNILRVKAMLRLRSAVRNTFMPARHGEQLGELTTDAEIVLADLKHHGYVDRPTAVLDRNGRVDAIATAQNEGARKLALRYLQAINLSDVRLHNLLRAHEAVED